MRKLLLLLLLLPTLSFAQTGRTSVTATVQDSNGSLYVNCSGSASFVGQNTTPGAGPYLINGSVFQTVVPIRCDSNGLLSVVLTDNALIRPVPSQWNFAICSASGYTGGPYCFQVLITISGASQDISTTLTANAPLLPTGGGGGGGFSPFLDVRSCSGGDIGTKINSCVTRLGTSTGTIFVPASLLPASTSQLVTLGKSQTLLVDGGGAGGTLTNVGIRLTDSTTDTSGVGNVKCLNGATLKLANGANTDLISDTNFATLTGTTNNYGLVRAHIEGCTLDGNMANNASGSAIKVYGRGNIFQNLIIQNTAQDGIYSEYGGTLVQTSADADFDANVSHVKILYGGGNAITNKGGIRSILDLHSEGYAGWGVENHGAIERVDSVQIDAGYPLNGAYTDVALEGSTAIMTNVQLCGGKWGYYQGDASGGLTNISSGIFCSVPALNGAGLYLGGSNDTITGEVINNKTGVVFKGSCCHNLSLTLRNNSGPAFDNTLGAGGSIINATVGLAGTGTLYTGSFFGSDSLNIRYDGTSSGSLVQSPNSGYQGSGFAVIDAIGGIQDNWKGAQVIKAFGSGWETGRRDGLAGSNGGVSIIAGDTTSSGYVLWQRPNGDNSGYMGAAATDINLQLQNGANFSVLGGSTTVDSIFSNGQITMGARLGATPQLAQAAHTGVGISIEDGSPFIAEFWKGAGQYMIVGSGTTSGLYLDSSMPLNWLNDTFLSRDAANVVDCGSAYQGKTCTFNVGRLVSTVATGTAPLTVTSTTPVANLTTVPTTYNHSGTQITGVHIVADTCTLGTSCVVTLTGAAIFADTNYRCTASDVTGANAIQIVNTAADTITITGTGTDVINYVCVGK